MGVTGFQPQPQKRYEMDRTPREATDSLAMELERIKRRTRNMRMTPPFDRTMVQWGNGEAVTYHYILRRAHWRTPLYLHTFEYYYQEDTVSSRILPACMVHQYTTGHMRVYKFLHVQPTRGLLERNAELASFCVRCSECLPPEPDLIMVYQHAYGVQPTAYEATGQPATNSEGDASGTASNDIEVIAVNRSENQEWVGEDTTNHADNAFITTTETTTASTTTEAVSSVTFEEDNAPIRPYQPSQGLMTRQQADGTKDKPPTPERVETDPETQRQTVYVRPTRREAAEEEEETDDTNEAQANHGNPTQQAGGSRTMYWDGRPALRNTHHNWV